MAANCGTLTPAVKFNGGTRRLRLPGCHLKPGLKLIDAIETLTRTRCRCGWGGNPVWWQLQNCIINHTRIKMSTEMKRWVANMLRRERKRKRGRKVGEGHAHLHPFGLWSAATAAAHCTAIGMSFGEGTLTGGIGIWLELLSLLACNVEHLQTNQICIRISFILFCTLLCAAAPLCASVCLCVCVCSKLLGLPARVVKVKLYLYLYLPVAKSEITSEMQSECPRPCYDLQNEETFMQHMQK